MPIPASIGSAVVAALDAVLGTIGLVRKAKAKADAAKGQEKGDQIEEGLANAGFPPKPN